VLVVDDHAVVRSGLTAFLMAFDDMELVGEADNGLKAVEMCEQLKPDVVLMDIMMPEMNGADATRKIRQMCPQTQVIALTSFPEEDFVQQALQAGAISYLLKNVPADGLAEAIRSAKEGHSTLAPEATQALIHAAAHPAETIRPLTGREQEVLPLLAEGLNNGEIAERLTISRSTVRFHVSNILAKLGATSRAQAVAVAIKHKLV
jgi:NarL family two-component system response regulator LiaR